MFREAEQLKEEDEISKSILEVRKELHQKMHEVLTKVSGVDSTVAQYNSLIFMAAFIYPADKQDIVDTENDFIYDKEKRLEYIKHVIALMKKCKS